MVALPCSKKQLFKRGFLAGLIAGSLASGVMLLLSLIAGGVLLPEAPGSTIAQAMPLPAFDYLHRVIQETKVLVSRLNLTAELYKKNINIFIFQSVRKYSCNFVHFHLEY